MDEVIKRTDVVKFLREEASACRHAQGFAEPGSYMKTYRMGQKDALLLAADEIERGSALDRIKDQSHD